MCEMKVNIKFGTDGWRGVISDDVTFENVKRVARAIAEYFNQKLANEIYRPKIAIGFDTRFLSDKYAAIVSEVLIRNGIDVFISAGPVPTPALSFAVKQRKLDAGVMITASHNPPEYNGIKIKNSLGGAAGIDITREVERFIEQGEDLSGAITGKEVETDITGDYVKFLRQYINFSKMKSAKFRVLVDVMHGSGNGFIGEALKGSKIKLEYTRRDINPSFGGLRPEPVLENLLDTQKTLKKGKFDICLVLDGDADRIAAFTGSGEFINPQKVLGLLIYHLVCNRKMSGGVVKTIVGTNMLDNITRDLGLKLYETPVGFKYISELMINDDILVGGEEAGGIGFKDYIPERDGSLAGLLLLEMMCCRKKSIGAILKEMEGKWGRFYYLRDDLKLKDLEVDVREFKKVKSLLDKEVVEVKDYDGLKLVASDGSWLMFRGSGTEPIMRVYAESKSLAKSKQLIELGRKLIFKNAV